MVSVSNEVDEIICDLLKMQYLMIRDLGGKQHQTLCVDNKNNFYLLLLFTVYLQLTYTGLGGLGLGVGVVVGGLYVHTLVKNLPIKILMLLFLVTIWWCVPACD